MFLVVILSCSWIEPHRKRVQLYIKHFSCKISGLFFTLRTGNVRKVETFRKHTVEQAKQIVDLKKQLAKEKKQLSTQLELGFTASAAAVSAIKKAKEDLLKIKEILKKEI